MPDSKYYLGGQDCSASTEDEVHVIEEDEPCWLTEAGDVLCVECGVVFIDVFPDEAQRYDRLDQVHEDWRVSR